MKVFMNKQFFLRRLVILLCLLLSVFGFSFWYKDALLALLSGFESFLIAHIKTDLFLSSVLYILVYLLDSLLALPLASALAFFAGRYFGFLLGFFLTMLGVLFGSLFSFLVLRYFVGLQFQRIYYDRLISFNKLLDEQGWIFFLFIRMIPIIPFSFVNIAAAFTSISVGVFLVTTFLGMTPLIVLLTALGSTTMSSVMSISTALMLLSGSAALLFVIVFLLKKYRSVL
jgi:uncharacterized membrane protein YdjX (TVP38/TMEM64 family)